MYLEGYGKINKDTFKEFNTVLNMYKRELLLHRNNCHFHTWHGRRVMVAIPGDTSGTGPECSDCSENLSDM